MLSSIQELIIRFSCKFETNATWINNTWLQLLADPDKKKKKADLLYDQKQVNLADIVKHQTTAKAQCRSRPANILFGLERTKKKSNLSFNLNSSKLQKTVFPSKAWTPIPDLSCLVCSSASFFSSPIPLPVSFFNLVTSTVMSVGGWAEILLTKFGFTCLSLALYKLQNLLTLSLEAVIPVVINLKCANLRHYTVYFRPDWKFIRLQNIQHIFFY